MATISIQQALKDIAKGKIVIIVDDEDRENEGDMAMAADKVTPEAINTMVTHARGLLCISMLSNRLAELRLPLMVSDNTSRFTTAFTVSVDALEDTTTGISAHDRAATVKTLIDPDSKPEDLARPGHMFPLRYADGGVLVRAGQTEAVLDLARLAGLYPAGVLCEVMSEDGSMAQMPELQSIGESLGIGIVTVADLIAYRRGKEGFVERVAEARIPTQYGDFKAVSYRSKVDSEEHVALVMGNVDPDIPCLVRVHSECLTGDTFGSKRCDCGEQRDLALQSIADEGTGIFLYMRQEGRGIGIHNKLKAYGLQDNGLDTVEANQYLGFGSDLRHYGVGAQILVDLGVKKMRFLTNNPKKIVGLHSFGLELTEQVPLVVAPTGENSRYMETKRTRMGHEIDFSSLSKKDDE